MAVIVVVVVVVVVAVQVVVITLVALVQVTGFQVKGFWASCLHSRFCSLTFVAPIFHSSHPVL